MKPTTLILRCYVEKQGSQWLACCLDLCLATQADSLLEAKEKLRNQINEYVYDALVGEDQAFAEQLLRRRAPLGDWLKYYGYVLLSQVGRCGNGLRPSCHWHRYLPRRFNYGQVSPVNLSRGKENLDSLRLSTTSPKRYFS